jgi:Putative peptidoglycan binding domain
MRFSEFKTLQEASSLLKVPSSPSGSEIANLQKALAAFNYNVNTTGEMDDLTTAAISKAQQEMGLPVTGKPDATTIDAMNGAIKQVPGMSDYMSKGALGSITKSEPAASKPEVRSTKSADTVVEPELEPSRSGPVPTTASANGGAVIIGNEKRTSGTISWRTNNPGNVAYGDRAKRFGALGYARAADGEHVAIMPTLEHGWKMQVALWRSPNYNNGTIDQGCRRWATGVGSKKGTSQYTIDLADAAGASIHTRVSDLSDEQLKNMVKKQAKLEGFKVGTVTTV